MIDKMMAMVERFNRDIIGVGIPSCPMMLSFDRGEARLKHIREELTELEDAISGEDLGDTVDAVLDLTYVALGALVEMGVSPLPVFEVVHEANMRKHAGTVDRRPENAGHDAVKPEGWKPPDLAPYLTLTRKDLDDALFARDMDSLDLGDENTFHPRILVIGHARHGKDTVSEMLRDHHGFSFTSSSMFCAENVVFPRLRNMYGYKTAEECFDDRSSHRSEWYHLIREYNSPDAVALGRAIFAEHGVYCGLRHHAEFNALRNAGEFDVSIWVDGSGRHPPEDRSSCSVEPWMADYVLDNNGTLEDLGRNLGSLMGTILKGPR